MKPDLRITSPEGGEADGRRESLAQTARSPALPLMAASSLGGGRTAPPAERRRTSGSVASHSEMVREQRRVHPDAGSLDVSEMEKLHGSSHQPLVPKASQPESVLSIATAADNTTSDKRQGKRTATTNMSASVRV
jgi:hypothetical protein